MNKPFKNYGSISAGSTQDVDFVSDRSRVFNETVDNIVTNIYTISTSFRTLENALKCIGTKKDNHSIRNEIHVIQLSTNEVASVTSREIIKLKTLMLRNDKQQQLQVEKLEENFKETIGRYSAIQKEIVNKQKAHLLVTVSIENEDSNEDNANNDERQRMLARDLSFEQEMLIERETRIRQIESDVLNVNEIMRELGSLVYEQGGTIDTIENSIDHAVGNIEEGAQQLLRASDYQKKRRRKLFYLVVICILVLIVLISIIIFSWKN